MRTMRSTTKKVGGNGDVTIRGARIAAAYAVAFLGAELMLAFASVLAGAICHAAICIVAIHHQFVVGRSSVADDGRRRFESGGAPFLLCVALVSVIRLCSLALPLGEISPALWPAVAALPMLVGVNSVRGATKPEDRVGGRWFAVQRWPRELLLALTGLPLGMLGSVAVHPEPLLAEMHVGPSLVAIGSLLLLAAAEEMVYRGLLQTSLVSVVGGSGVAVTALFNATTTLGNRSWTAVLFVAAVAVGFGSAVHRTRCLVGVTLAHWAMLMGMLLIWPRVF